MKLKKISQLDVLFVDTIDLLEFGNNKVIIFFIFFHFYLNVFHYINKTFHVIEA